ncbi:MAG TPA: phenylalanine--tRNA ligase subunit beta [Candidatus Nanopusillus sp.]|nr:phenylalanine--tRNA ligase subunit beta [Candidatus Nanopusillus sp.]
MPTIEVSHKDLTRLLGKEITIEDLENLILHIKGEVDEVLGDIIKIEVKDTNRPDLWSVEGIVRELKGILGIETGLPSYHINKGDYTLIVDPNVQEIRPYVAAAVVKNIKLGKHGFSSLIQLQEKIMSTFGRKRRKVAIGTHNLDLIKFPVYYKAVDPDSVKFTPLYESSEMTLREVLDKTETGRKYKHLLEGMDKYPLLIDSKGEVISFPPIINSNTIGKISENTRNIFIDVTGTDLESVSIALNSIVLALADRGGEVYSVTIEYSNDVIETPVIEERKLSTSYNKIKRIIGMDLKDSCIVDLLKKRRLSAEIKDNEITIKYLNYRNDIISAQDVAEEVLIAYGYNKIQPKTPSIYTKGGLTKRRLLIDKIREIMVGMRAIELYTPVLVSKDVAGSLYDKKYLIELLNPVSTQHNVVRPTLLASFLQILANNKGIPLPAEFFEVGITAIKRNLRRIEEWKLFYTYLDSEVSFNLAKEKLERLFVEIHKKYSLQKTDIKFGIPGRSGRILIDGVDAGWIAEIHPAILDKLDIDLPMVCFEISISTLLKLS